MIPEVWFNIYIYTHTCTESHRYIYINIWIVWCDYNVSGGGGGGGSFLCWIEEDKGQIGPREDAEKVSLTEVVIGGRELKLLMDGWGPSPPPLAPRLLQLLLFRNSLFNEMCGGLGTGTQQGRKEGRKEIRKQGSALTSVSLPRAQSQSHTVSPSLPLTQYHSLTHSLSFHLTQCRSFIHSLNGARWVAEMQAWPCYDRASVLPPWQLCVCSLFHMYPPTHPFSCFQQTHEIPTSSQICCSSLCMHQFNPSP